MSFDVHITIKSIMKIVELFMLRKFVKKDSYLKKIDELEFRKMKSKNPQLYESLIDEIKNIFEDMK